MVNIKNKVQKAKKKKKTIVILGASLFGQKVNYIIPTINYYPRNGSGLELWKNICFFEKIRLLYDHK